MVRRTIRYSRGSPLAIVGLLALVLGVAGIAIAAIPSSDGVIHGCYKKAGGALRVIDTEKSPPDTCARGEVPISWNQQGPPGPPGTSIIASLKQTADFTSGAGAGNATTMPLSGGQNLNVAANSISFIYPMSGVGIDPPDSCDATDSTPRELHLDYVLTGLPQNPYNLSTVTLHSWVVPYNDANTAPQLSAALDDFRTIKNPFGDFTGGIEIRAWDTCAGGNQRWGIGGVPNGFGFGADMASVK